LELFSLEEEANLLPGGLFVFGFGFARLEKILQAAAEWMAWREARGTVANLLRIICCEYL
jgi:hypothetical protein